MNRIFIFILLFFFHFSTYGNAEEIRIYKDRNGNIVITNRHIPEAYKTKTRETDSVKHETPSGITQRKRDQAAQVTNTYDLKSVAMEKKRLEAEIQRLKNQASAGNGKAPHYQFYIDAYESNLQRLEKDPAGYFEKQGEMEKEAAKILRGQAPKSNP